MISKDRRLNIICTIDALRGDFLEPPHGKIPAALITNKNIKVRPFENNKNIQRQSTDLLRNFG